MNRTCVALLIVATLGAGTAPSGAEGPAEQDSGRKVAATYAAGVGVDCRRALGCVVLVPKKGEKYVLFSVEDASGTPVYGTVTHELRERPHVFGPGNAFCGEGSSLTPDAKPVYIYFENHLGSWHNCPGGASKGVVRASFFRR